MKQKDILLLAGSFFFLVLLYLGFSVYHNSVTSTISGDLNTQIVPISPTFDEKTISDLKKRSVITPVYETGGQTSPSPIPSVQASPTPVPTASPSSQLNTNTSTTSGTKQL